MDCLLAEQSNSFDSNRSKGTRSKGGSLRKNSRTSQYQKTVDNTDSGKMLNVDSKR